MVLMGLSRTKRKCHLLTEVTVRLGLVLLFIEMERLPPFTRLIHPEEAWLYRNPMTDSYVPGEWLWKMVLIVPFTVILVCFVVTRSKADLAAATMVVTLAGPLNGVITDIIKLCVGRPRPDFIFRCWPDGVIPRGALLDSPLPCTGQPEDILEGRKSFPSGHSSFSFTTWGFVFFYLAGKLGTFHSGLRSPAPSLHLLLLLGCLLTPLAIALSRTADYHHHWQDVLVGSIIGLVTVWVVYRQHYPSISSPNSAIPLASQPAKQYLPLDRKLPI